MNELEHPKLVADITKALRKIDGFMHGNTAIKNALDQSLSTGKLGIFMLDCIIADQVAVADSIGKVPISDIAEVVEKSPLISQFGSIKYIAKTLSAQGVTLSVWAFIGDDDFQYSVSPEYSTANLSVRKSLEEQIKALDHKLQEIGRSMGIESTVSGWLLQETMYPEILQTRAFLLNEVVTGVTNLSLAAKVMQRFNSFVNWRTAIAEGARLNPSVSDELIHQQAIQELTSFVTQGHIAPVVIHRQVPNMPLIFANTYPDVGTQHLDDECLRFGQKLGLSSYAYGTIHLPGPEKLAKFLGAPKDPSFKPMMFSCGEKVMGSGKERWRKTE